VETYPGGCVQTVRITGGTQGRRRRVQRSARFADSDGDGVGDLPGVRSRLPYLAGLGHDEHAWFREALAAAPGSPSAPAARPPFGFGAGASSWLPTPTAWRDLAVTATAPAPAAARPTAVAEG